MCNCCFGHRPLWVQTSWPDSSTVGATAFWNIQTLQTVVQGQGDCCLKLEVQFEQVWAGVMAVYAGSLNAVQSQYCQSHAVLALWFSQDRFWNIAFKGPTVLCLQLGHVPTHAWHAWWLVFAEWGRARCKVWFQLSAVLPEAGFTFQDWKDQQLQGGSEVPLLFPYVGVRGAHQAQPKAWGSFQTCFTQTSFE